MNAPTPVDTAKYPPIPPDMWMVLVWLGDQSSVAYAPDWETARTTLARTIAAIYRAGKLPESVTKTLLILLTEARQPHAAMGSWFTACAAPPCRFQIHSPLGQSANDYSVE